LQAGWAGVSVAGILRAGGLPLRAEEGLFVPAEQEDEAGQVIMQLAKAVGGVADELCQRCGQAAGSRSSQPARNWSISASSAASTASSLTSGMGITVLRG
jgi:hypothetical protein